MEGYEVLVVPNSLAAVRLCCEHAIDLVITDVFMPEKDGLEVIQELRAAAPRVKIIAISGGPGKGTWDVLDIARFLGANRVLSKPFTLPDLLALLTELSRGSDTADRKEAGASGTGRLVS